MAEDTTPVDPTPAEAAADADEPQSELVTWEDSKGNKHTGSRSGSAYKRHLAEQKLQHAADKATAAADGTAETSETAGDAATADPDPAKPADTAGEHAGKAAVAAAKEPAALAPAGADSGGEPAAPAADTKADAAKPKPRPRS